MISKRCARVKEQTNGPLFLLDVVHDDDVTVKQNRPGFWNVWVGLYFVLKYDLEPSLRRFGFLVRLGLI